MADMITLTQQPLRYTLASFTAGTVFQPLFLAVDIGNYDFLDLETGIIGNEGSVTAFTLELWTGMQTQVDDGWVSAGQLISSVTVNAWNPKNIPNGLLRYVRWKVTGMTAGTAITFFVRGMARRYA